ncbi:hypothetical protein Cabys_3857 [Caldithrix abyssi DSM 13497]|uniref:Uncharacterized protein n=1 Tax=Caldithrix abyssi DSM 13497 TaxID=880073 RepID=A0A1J1CF14_CALAY|nr:hypothetical protein Cabys_3857 [Caldithrix abyssi DSM 13497]
MSIKKGRYFTQHRPFSLKNESQTFKFDFHQLFKNERP